MRAAVIAVVLVTNIVAVANGFVAGLHSGIGLGRTRLGQDPVVGMKDLIGSQDLWLSKTNENAWMSEFDGAESHLKGLNVEDFDKAEMSLNARGTLALAKLK